MSGRIALLDFGRTGSSGDRTLRATGSVESSAVIFTTGWSGKVMALSGRAGLEIVSWEVELSLLIEVSVGTTSKFDGAETV